MKTKPSEQITSITSDAKKDILKAVKGDLAEKTSRTTFRITKEANEAMNWLVEHYGTTLKSVLDLLCFNVPSARDAEPGKDTFLFSVIRQSRDFDFKKLNRSVRRTMVVSKKSLTVLNNVSKKVKIQRDLLVDRGVLFLKLVVETSQEEEKKKHAEAYEMIDQFYTTAEDLEDKLDQMLGDDDPIVKRFGYVIIILDNLHSAIKAEMEKGEPIDPDSF